MTRINSSADVIARIQAQLRSSQPLRARAFRLWTASDLQSAAAEFRAGIACSGNAPLVQDMRKTLDTVCGLVTDKSQEQHVLLANYTAAGRPH